MVSKTIVNESMPWSLLPAAAKWRTGTILDVLTEQCTFHSKLAAIIVNGELGQYHFHSRN